MRVNHVAKYIHSALYVFVCGFMYVFIKIKSRKKWNGIESSCQLCKSRNKIVYLTSFF